MDEDEVFTLPFIKSTVVNNLMEISRQNALAIHNLAKEVAIIKRITSKMDNTYSTE